MLINLFSKPLSGPRVSLAAGNTACSRARAALALDWDAACLRPEQTRRVVKTSSIWQVRQPIYSGCVERWRRYEPWLGPLAELAPR